MPARPDVTDSSIRAFAPADTDTCYEICLKTADAGGDASALHADPRILGEVWVAPYLVHSPHLAFVVEDEEGVGGYVVGAAHTTEFEEWAEQSWWPPLRGRYPQGTFATGTADADTLNLIHTPLPMAKEIVDEHPAHLHIDMLPRLQGRGVGRRLLDHLFAGLRAAGADRVHLGVSPLNTNAIGFYERIGFVELVPDLVILGRSTAPTVTPAAGTGG
jgi:ribosomal protein S18 acetylase RimI-like enzyme